MNWECSTFGASYGRIVRDVYVNGQRHSPRGIGTREVIGARIHVANAGRDVMPIGWNRKLVPKIGLAEGLQLIAGESHPDLMIKLAPNFKNFTNGGVWFHGAYGPRIRNQIPKVLETLKNDPDSRQALMTIWDPAYDGYGGTNDTPCTVALQFFIRGAHLDAVIFMRSNDVWWGLPYDVYQFTMLQTALADLLDVNVGSYTHNVGSLHVYDRDEEGVKNLLIDREKYHYNKWDFITTPREDTLEDMREWAHSILVNNVYPGTNEDYLASLLHA